MPGPVGDLECDRHRQVGPHFLGEIRQQGFFYFGQFLTERQGQFAGVIPGHGGRIRGQPIDAVDLGQLGTDHIAGAGNAVIIAGGIVDGKLPLAGFRNPLRRGDAWRLVSDHRYLPLPKRGVAIKHLDHTVLLHQKAGITRRGIRRGGSQGGSRAAHRFGERKSAVAIGAQGDLTANGQLDPRTGLQLGKVDRRFAGIGRRAGPGLYRHARGGGRALTAKGGLQALHPDARGKKQGHDHKGQGQQAQAGAVSFWQVWRGQRGAGMGRLCLHFINMGRP